MPIKQISFKCYNCGELFETVDQLRGKEKGLPSPPVGESYKCPKCGRNYFNIINRGVVII